MLFRSTVLENFYGGGSLGAVKNDATSILTDCTMMGNVFGGGFSVQIPKVEVRELRTPPFQPEPYYNTFTGVYEEGGYPGNVEYTWVHGTLTNNSDALVDSGDTHSIKTPEDLDALGKVFGNTSLTIKGSTTVAGSVFGGGDESPVEGNTIVKIQGGTQVTGSVYAGGNKGAVNGNSSVTIEDPTP